MFYTNKFAVFAQNDYEDGVEQNTCKLFHLTNQDTFDMSDIDGWFKTGILSFGDDTRYKRLMKLTFLTTEGCQDCILHITVYSGKTMDVEGTSESHTLGITNINRVLYMDLTAKYFQIKVRTNEMAEHFVFQGILAEYTIRGEL